MIQYLNKKDIYGPFHSRDSVYLPHSAEVTSDQFLKTAYSKQIKELNGTTAMAGVNVMKSIVNQRRQPHTPLDNVNTPLHSARLLKGAPPGTDTVNHYLSELNIEKAH